MDAETGEDMLSGLAECFNLDDARIKWKLHGVKGDAMLGAGAAHQEALDHIVGHILPQDPPWPISWSPSAIASCTAASSSPVPCASMTA